MLLLTNYFILNILIVSITVVSSFFLEYILELSPCRICLYQRYLWLLLLSTLIYFLFFLKKFKTLGIFIIFFILLILVILSIYHSGIELGLFSNIITCTSNSGLEANSIEQLDKIIRQTENTSCSFHPNQWHWWVENGNTAGQFAPESRCQPKSRSIH